MDTQPDSDLPAEVLEFRPWADSGGAALHRSSSLVLGGVAVAALVVGVVGGLLMNGRTDAGPPVPAVPITAASPVPGPAEELPLISELELRTMATPMSWEATREAAAVAEEHVFRYFTEQSTDEGITYVEWLRTTGVVPNGEGFAVSVRYIAVEAGPEGADRLPTASVLVGVRQTADGWIVDDPVPAEAAAVNVTP